MPKVGKKQWDGLLLHKVHSMWMMWIGISDLRSLRSQHIKGTNKSTLEMIRKFICCSMMWVISDHWFWSSQRNPLVVKFDIWTLHTFLKSAHLNIQFTHTAAPVNYMIVSAKWLFCKKLTSIIPSAKWLLTAKQSRTTTTDLQVTINLIWTKHWSSLFPFIVI